MARIRDYELDDEGVGVENVDPQRTEHFRGKVLQIVGDNHRRAGLDSRLQDVLVLRVR
jgi:hypothetical protein